MNHAGPRLAASVMEYVRENPVLGLGRGCLALGAFVVLTAAVGELLTLANAYVRRGHAAPSPAIPSGFLAFQLQHHRSFALAQVVLGMVVAISGLFVLRRRTWALRLVEVLAWLVLLCGLIAPLFVHSFRHAPTSMLAFVLASGCFVTVGWAVILGRLIRFLRSPRVRAAFRVV